jgi:hypothetical protein
MEFIAAGALVNVDTVRRHTLVDIFLPPRVSLYLCMERTLSFAALHFRVTDLLAMPDIAGPPDQILLLRSFSAGMIDTHVMLTPVASDH